MQLKDYIKGNRKGKEANRLEREAMNDPFLQDALDGFDAVPADNHAEIIQGLEKKFTQRNEAVKRNRSFLFYGSIAASILLIVGFGVYFLHESNNSLPDIAMLQSSQKSFVMEEESLLPAPAEIMADVDLPKQERTPPTPAGAANRAAPEPEIQIHHDVEHIMQMEESVVAEEELENPIEETNAQRSTEDAIISEESIKDRQRETTTARSASKNAPSAAPAIFGPKEFQQYCQQTADKDVCNGKRVTVKVSFFIDEAGKPTNINCTKYTCEEAKKEIEKLLNASPPWTDTNKKRTMTVKW